MKSLSEAKQLLCVRKGRTRSNQELNMYNLYILYIYINTIIQGLTFPAFFLASDFDLIQCFLMASSMLVTFQSAEFHCSFLRRHGLQQNQEPTLQGKGTPFRTEPPVRVCLQAPGCSSLRVCSCHAVNFNRQRYSTCKAWWPCSSTEQISSFAAWRGAAQHPGSSTRRRYSGKELE